MNNIKFILLCFFLSGLTQAQVIINSDHAALEVQGSITIRKNISLGGDDNTPGKEGKPGYVMVSQGPNKPPAWKMLKIPDFEPHISYLMKQDAASSNSGFKVSNRVAGRNLYHNTTSLKTFLGTNKSGGELSELEKKFTIFAPKNTTVFTLETVIHLNSSEGNNQSSPTYHASEVACGVFVDDVMSGVRVITLDRPDVAIAPFTTLTIIATANDLALGEHTVKVACHNRANFNDFNKEIGFGKAVHTNLNDFITTSSLKIEMYELPEPQTVTPIYN